MRKTNKRGFTIVELVIVIAVIAILAAVLIPTFTNLVKKANRSADIQLVRNMNMALQVDGASIKTYDTAYDALKAAAAAGYDLTKITTSDKENTILWDERNQCFAYMKADSDELEYVPNSRKDDIPTPNYQLWKVYTEAVANGEYEYSVYWNGGNTTETLSVKNVGFDAGDAVIGGITYTGTAGNDVVIRTNSFATTLTISDSSTSSKIYHYDNLGKLIITECAMQSFHENGIVGYAEIQKGHLQVETGAAITLVYASSTEVKVTNNGEIDRARASEQNIVNDLNTKSTGVTFEYDGESIDIDQVVKETQQKNCQHPNTEVIASKRATCTENGNKEYWTCSACGKLFGDASATIEITENDILILATGQHSYDVKSHICTICNTVDPEWAPFKGKVDETGALIENAFKNGAGLENITELVIPEGITAIGNYAFHGCSNLTSLTIPDSVTSIGVGAFQGSGITSIVIPDRVTLIDSKTFYECSALESITIGKGVTSIVLETSGAFTGAFIRNNNLTTITVNPKNVTYKSEGNCILTKNGATLVLGCKNSTIPASVTKIGDYAFYCNDGLESITIPANVTSIGSYAFSGCKALRSVTIPNSVTAIGAKAFLDCTALTTVSLSTAITEIAEGTFSKCTSLNSITIPDSVITIGSSAFQSCSSITEITIPAAVITIGANAFNACSLTEITIPENVTTIGSNAFTSCPLTSAVFKKSTGWNVDSANRFLGTASTAAKMLIGVPVNNQMYNNKTWTRS